MVDKRKELLRMLNNALIFEESGMVILGNTCRSFVEEDKVSGLTDAQKQKVIKMLNCLTGDSEKHGNLLRDLISRISEGEEDAS